MNSYMIIGLPFALMPLISMVGLTLMDPHCHSNQNKVAASPAEALVLALTEAVHKGWSSVLILIDCYVLYNLSQPFEPVSHVL